MTERRRLPLAAAGAVFAAAFTLYWSTLLPGLDLGDTASFQVMAGADVISPRDAYPLYFALGRVFTWATPGEPAFALNLASAVEGALACGLLVLLAYELSGSLLAATASALLFAGSYTFWSQSVTAEVYALHVCLVVATLLLLLRWERRPTLTRLALFFLVYAFGFGNHLSMILLAPAYALFLLLSAPGGWRSIVTPRVTGLAAVCAVAGALPYVWNLWTLWLMPVPPANPLEGLSAFWFDVTKTDWRRSMILQVHRSAWGERLRMYLFDFTQQVGWVGLAGAVLGIGFLLRRSPRRALLAAAVYLINVLFALGYNVGDSHVFFLPSHLVVALLVASAAAGLDRVAAARGAISAAAVAWAFWTMYDNYPALDRSSDRRPLQLVAALSSGLDDQHAVLLTDLNWQAQNGLDYFAKRRWPRLAHALASDVLLYMPALVRDNTAIGRDIVVTERAAADVLGSYGGMFSSARDARAPAPRLLDAVGDLKPGTRYALCVLRADKEYRVDWDDLHASLAHLTEGQLETLPQTDYVAVVGTAGRVPARVEAGNRPFRFAVELEGVRVEVRMESWLAFDTIRRMGFGHVVANRGHALIVERGISFVALDGSARPIRTAYAGGLFAPQARFLIRAPCARAAC